MRASNILGFLPRHAAAFTVAVLLFFAAGAIATAAPAALYVTDGDVIHAFDATTGAPLPGFSDIALLGATGLAVGPDSNLYAVNTIPSQVFRYDPATGAQTGPNPFVSFNGQNDGHDVQGPQGMRFGPGGNLYIADVTLSNVHVYDPAGNSLGSIDGPSLSQPGDVAFDTTGNLPANNVFVANPATANILVSTGLGQPFVDFTAPIAGGLINPVSLSFGPDHDLYVLDVGGGEPKIIRFAPNATPDGTVVSFTGDNFFTPAYLAFGPDGNLYVSGLDFNTGAGQIRRYGTDGTPLGVLVDTGLANPTFMVFSVPEPSGLAMLGMGIFGIFLYRRRR